MSCTCKMKSYLLRWPSQVYHTKQKSVHSYTPVLVFKVHRTGLEPSWPGSRPVSSSLLGRALSALGQIDAQKPQRPAEVYCEGFLGLQSAWSMAHCDATSLQTSGQSCSDPLSPLLLLCSASSIGWHSSASAPVTACVHLTDT